MKKTYTITINEEIAKNRYKEKCSWEIETSEPYKKICDSIRIKLKKNESFSVKQIGLYVPVQY